MDSEEDETTPATTMLRTEVEEFFLHQQERRRMFPRAVLVGVLAGALAVAFRLTLEATQRGYDSLLRWSHSFPVWGWLFPVLIGVVGAVASVGLVRRFAPDAAGSGIPHLEGVLRGFSNLHAARILPVKFVGGLLAMGSGLVMGREGPSVQMGAAVSDLVSKSMRLTQPERRTLMASGAGAGLAAAFNAPLAGLVFVLEEVQRDFMPVMFGCAFLAAVSGDIIARAVCGNKPALPVPAMPIEPIGGLPCVIAFGAICGLIGAAFNKTLLFSLDRFADVPARWRLVAVGAVGAIVGAVGWFAPHLLGGGHALTEAATRGELALGIIPVYFLVRFALTMLCYSTGAPGGVFAPLLALGALGGLLFGGIAKQVMPAGVGHAETYAVLGMAALFAAIVRAPLTGIVLILEMTGSYSQMLSLLIVCFSAYLVAEFLNIHPLYEALLERDLMRRGMTMHHEEPRVMEFVVDADAPFANREVRTLGLPPGCVLVRLKRGQIEEVPNGGTVLRPGDRITAVISPQVKEAVAQLRHGCEIGTA